VIKCELVHWTDVDLVMMVDDDDDDDDHHSV